MTDTPDRAEQAVRDRLVDLIDGPDAEPSAVPPMPEERPRDWLDDILNTEPADDEADEEQPPAKSAKPKRKPKPGQPESSQAKKRKKRKKPKPGQARTPWDRPPAPRQSLTEAWDAVPYRLKWLAYHSTAGYLGWTCGLVDYTTYVTAWIADTGMGPQAVFWGCVAAAAFLLYRRTRGWWWPIAMLAAVPAVSIVVGVLLYAPTV